jgi:hypothetical protein
LEVVVLKPIKKIVFIWSREYLESLIFDVFEKWVATITKLHFLKSNFKTLSFLKKIHLFFGYGQSH